MRTLSIIAALVATAVYGHSEGHFTRFVAGDGSDQGLCLDAAQPCRTLQYALSKAGKGDALHVAEGVYTIAPTERMHILTGMVPIEGGFSRRDGFAKADPARNVSHIIGMPIEHRADLSKMGFALLQDEKIHTIALSSKEQRVLSSYHAMTKQVEGPAACESGKAGNYTCKNIDLLSHIPLQEFSTNPRAANDIWGFRDQNDNREYALIGLYNGTAIVDVTDAEHPREVGTVSGNGSTWRDVKVYQCLDQPTQRYRSYAYVTTEASQGLQVIDLTQLPTSVRLVTTLNDFSSAHNVYLANTDYASGGELDGFDAQLFIAGANKNNGGHRVYDLHDPLLPTLRTVSDAGYMHDGSSFVLNDARASQCAAGHNPCEVYIDFNENTVDIWDITDKASPVRLSSTPYQGASYTHSGWWSADKNYVFIQDELDEQKLGLNTTLRTLDIHNLRSPSVVVSYTGPTRAIDHNGFTKGNRYYISNYERGLTVLDVSNPKAAIEVGHFDTYSIPEDNTANFNGAWGAYPYLPSGNILVSDINYGLFVLRDRTNPVGHVGSDHFALCKDTRVNAQGVIGFATSNSSVGENVGTVVINVNRTTGTTGAVSVRYSIESDSATNSDYSPTTDVLTWADGETAAKTITIAINDDHDVESDESFTVVLTDVSGGAELDATRHIVTIVDNDKEENDKGGSVGWLFSLLVFVIALGRKRHN